MKILSIQRPFAVHRDPGPDPFQPVDPGEGRELRPVIGVHDLGRAELVDRLVQRFDAEVSLQRVGYPPGQHLPGMPVHDGDQIQETPARKCQFDLHQGNIPYLEFIVGAIIESLE